MTSRLPYGMVRLARQAEHRLLLTRGYDPPGWRAAVDVGMRSLREAAGAATPRAGFVVQVSQRRFGCQTCQLSPDLDRWHRPRAWCVRAPLGCPIHGIGDDADAVTAGRFVPQKR